MISLFISRFSTYNYIFEELVKRDFKKRYKRTVLGIAWSMLGPLFHLAIITLVFSHFFGRQIPHFPIHVFSGLMLYNFFRESTSQGMQSLVANAGIITKIKIPKYLFLLSKNVASLINFGLLLIIFFIVAFISGVEFSWRFLLLIYPIITLVLFNIGVGLVLSALFVFFKDIQYLYDILTMLVMWTSAIFFSVESFPVAVQRFLLINPIFAHVHYVRLVVLHDLTPAWHIFLACGLSAILALAVGAFFYKRYNYRFVYYM